MVTRAYLLHEPPRPSKARVFLHQSMVPMLINVLGSVEQRLESVAVQTRGRPAAALAACFAAGCVMATVAPLRRR